MTQFTPMRESQVQARKQAANERLDTVTAVVIAIVAAIALITVAIVTDTPMITECGVNTSC